MAEYQKSSGVSGAWVKASELTSGVRAKIVSETEPTPSMYTNKDGSIKMQDVCKVLFEGKNEPLNMNLNRATINALVDAFGSDSKSWMNNYLVLETEKMKVAGKSVIALFLVPEGYEKKDDADGYTVITKIGQSNVSQTLKREEEIPTINLDDEEEIRIEDVPF